MKNLIKFFHAAPTDGAKLDISRVISAGAKVGYIVHPDCCTQDVLDFLESEEYNPNSTFYRTWAEITDKSRFELFIDQLAAYATGYGTNFEQAVYCPNGEPININYKTYTIIKAITPEQMFELCMGVLRSGIALDGDTLNSLIEYVAKCVKEYHFPIDLDQIENRDALCIISDKLDIYPETGLGIIRVLFYKVFGSPMPIQGHAELNQLLGFKKRRRKFNATADLTKADLTQLTEDQLVALSSVFLRYKKFLLGLKKRPGNAPIVNKLRRLAVKNHKPMIKGFWENFTNLDEKIVRDMLPSELEKLDNNFKITRLIQMIKLRELQNTRKIARFFHIRNGKTWTDKNTLAPYAGWWEYVRMMLVGKLVANLSAIQKREGIRYIKFPENLDLACPVSEKKFLGNIPYGSKFNLAKSNNYFGVYWRNEWGTNDYDLSFISDNCNKLGWNAGYYNDEKSIVFSGDMTWAEPEATEMFYADGDQEIPDGNLILNRYSGNPGSQWRLFFGQDKITNFGKNYMVDPNTIQLSEMGISSSAQQLVGRIQNGQLLINVADMPDECVSSFNEDFQEAFKAQAESYAPLKPILLAAGYKEITPELEKEGERFIDLTDLKKDTLLNLFK